jgi:Fe-S-cluster containining protein
MKKKRPDLILQLVGSVGFLNLEQGCPFLNTDNRCTIYRERPLMCRVFPFMLHEDPVSKDVIWDVSWCSRHDPGEMPLAKEIKDWLTAFEITEADFYGFAALYSLRMARQHHVCEVLSQKHQEELTRIQTEIHTTALATGALKARPILDKEFFRSLVLCGHGAYTYYLFQQGTRPITTRSLVREGMRQMKGAILQKFKVSINY